MEDVNGDCIDGEVPCVGNPVKNPRIAEQNNSGVNGGRFGNTRNRPKPHRGIDIKNDVGSPFFSTHTGTVDGRGYQKDGLGYYITIRFQKDGTYYYIRYGHLEKEGRPGNDTQINVGDVIGIQGTSGNLSTAIREGYTDDVHSHITVGRRNGSGWDHDDDYTKIDPEPFLTTKFDSNGNPINSTDC